MDAILNDKLDIDDLQLIVRNLINFIVIEGKEYVNEDEMGDYVSSYVEVLIKTIHLIEKRDISITVEDIARDISMYLE